MRHNGLVAGILVSALVAAAPVTMAGASSKKSTATTTTKPKPKKPKPKKPEPSTGIGVTFTVQNQVKQYEAVKFVAVIDPAQSGNQFLTPPAGDRFVAVEIQITGKSAGNDSNDANNNLSVVGSNGQVYSADFYPVTECTDFSNGQYSVTKGQSETGCVTYAMPTGVGVAHVKYNPDSGFSTNEATWTLSPPL
jgi:hypothetical protein